MGIHEDLHAAVLKSNAETARARREELRSAAADINKAIARALAKRHRLTAANRATEYILSCNDEIATLKARRSEIRDEITRMSKVIRKASKLKRPTPTSNPNIAT